MISINPTTKSTATNKLEEILKANKRTRKSIPNYFAETKTKKPPEVIRFEEILNAGTKERPIIPNYFDKAMESYGKALIKSS